MTASILKAGKTDPKVLVLGGVLALALAGVGFSWHLTRAPAGPAPAAATPAAVLAPDLQEQASQLAQSVQSRLLADADAIDVSWPAAAAPAPVTRARVVQAEVTFRLRGIARDGSQPVAFLDDRTLGLGESIDGFKLVEIADESVTLQDERGRKHVVRLYSGE